MGGSNFRVVIVGGSIAGLSLALMLEQNGIDFVVLEAYPTIAPNLGASIALRPNGFRIMDQLGAYEDVLKCGQYPVDDFQIHDPSGKPLFGARNLRRGCIERYGYPIMFFTRRELVQILYDHIKSKDKVLAAKRVQTVKDHHDSVTVTTTDGDVFEADLVVGADGLHSAIRQEIEKKASDPGGFKTETLPARFAGVFGTSDSDLQSPKGSVVICSGKDSSLYVAAGPDDTTFWMVFFKLDKTYLGRDTPCRGEKAEEEYSKKYWDHPISPGYKYSDLRETAIVSVCTPLHEYVIENWHAGRCVVIGDSAHKVNPVGAQGGNAALESSAALMNGIMKLLKAHGSEKIPREEFGPMLDEVQNLRKPRTSFLCQKSMDFQELCAETSPFYTVMNRYIMPLLGEDAMFDDICAGYPSAVSLESHPIPSRPRSIPYYDELIRQPKPRGIPLSILVSTILIGLSALGVYLLPMLSNINGTFRLIESAAAASHIHELNIPLQSLVDADQFPGLDKLCKTMVAVFLPVVSGAEDLRTKVQAAYFLVGVYLPLLSIIAVEGYRWNSKRTLLWSPTLWTGLSQLLGLGLVLPFYLLAVFVTSRGPSYWTAHAQAAPTHKLQALLPSLVFAYLAPSIAMFALPATSPLLQPTIAFWQGSPALVILATELLSRAFTPPPNPKETAAAVTLTNKPEPFLTAPPHRAPVDLRPTRRLHSFTAAAAAAVHLALVCYVAVHPDLSLTSTFLPPAFTTTFATTTVDNLLAALTNPAQVPTIAHGTALFLQYDLLLTLAATFLWSALTLHDLRRVGLTERAGANATSLLLLAAGWALVGPGAATALLWRWREECVGGFVPRRMVKGEAEGQGLTQRQEKVVTTTTTEGKGKWGKFGQVDPEVVVGVGKVW
ncbi:fad binding domain protein [Diplodia corticola]|uniref:Fad binding domain protein n=1 Tax=Diplodia corticola TaxID=236234 RepID=A0A1J9SLR3_9PEZI|nr:fad binding domain protein [Diplodia corticola]OJD40549.1 fad binding domain protein [Diplodia corticola]